MMATRKENERETMSDPAQAAAEAKQHFPHRAAAVEAGNLFAENNWSIEKLESIIARHCERITDAELCLRSGIAEDLGVPLEEQSSEPGDLVLAYSAALKAARHCPDIGAMIESMTGEGCVATLSYGDDGKWSFLIGDEWYTGPTPEAAVRAAMEETDASNDHP